MIFAKICLMWIHHYINLKQKHKHECYKYLVTQLEWTAITQSVIHSALMTAAILLLLRFFCQHVVEISLNSSTMYLEVSYFKSLFIFLSFPPSKLHEVFPDFDFLSDADLACDIVCLIYDVGNPYSFEYCAKVFKVVLCVPYSHQSPGQRHDWSTLSLFHISAILHGQ